MSSSTARIHSEDSITESMNQPTSNGDIEYSREELLNTLKVIDPEEYRLLRNQDKQIAACQAADEKYHIDNDLSWIISFWEEIWKDGGPKFEGSGWMFRLPDLYIKSKRYNDAIAICNQIKATRQSYYHDKADKYIQRIEKLRDKATSKINK